MNTTKRIEYIDALRGFTMILVVAVHVYSLCFMHESAKEYDLSYNNFFGLFRMPLFYFISGFVFFKLDRYWDYATLKNFISSKIRVQLFSTLVFFILFCWLYQRDIYDALFDTQKAGFWFTYILFIYFILYIVIDKTVCCITRKNTFNNYTIITSFIVGLLLYYLINNGLLLNILSPQITTLSSFSKWQYFLYFSFGCCIHRYYDSFLKFQNAKYMKEGILLLFTFSTIFIFYQNQTDIYIHNYILKLFSSLSGITLIMYIFKDKEKYISNSTKLGACLQFIGKHTLDIYFIHYFFLPYNMSYIGKWLEKNPNYLLEFCISLTLALLVIVCCLLMSIIIRLSPTFAYYLLGQKRN